MGNVVQMNQSNIQVSRLSASIIEAVESELSLGDMTLAEVVGCLETVKSHYMIQAWMQAQLDERE